MMIKLLCHLKESSLRGGERKSMNQNKKNNDNKKIILAVIRLITVILNYFFK